MSCPDCRNSTTGDCPKHRKVITVTVTKRTPDNQEPSIADRYFDEMHAFDEKMFDDCGGNYASEELKRLREEDKNKARMLDKAFESIRQMDAELAALRADSALLDKALADLEKATNDNERLRGHLANAVAVARGKYTAYEIEILLGKEAETCGWKEQDGFCTSGTWSTDCGEDFIFETGTPKENGLIFCPYCGRPLVEVNDLDETEQEGEE